MISIQHPSENDLYKTPVDVPLFPLSQMVLLPGEPLPLHIFEESFRIMTESAISGERLIAMAHIKPGFENVPGNIPEIYDVAGLGRIVLDERLTDGRFNLVLLGLKRVKIKKIIQEKPYKRAQVEILPDKFSETSHNVISFLSSEIIQTVQKLINQRKKKGFFEENSATLSDTLSREILPLGDLCDLSAAAISLSPLEKQMIMNETDVIRRAEALLFSLQYELRLPAVSRESFTSPTQLH